MAMVMFLPAHVCWQVESTRKESGVPDMHLALSMGFGASRLRDATSLCTKCW
jgi:hypothetical protein